jgi:hypothetical protein
LRARSLIAEFSDHDSTVDEDNGYETIFNEPESDSDLEAQAEDENEAAGWD